MISLASDFKQLLCTKLYRNPVNTNIFVYFPALAQQNPVSNRKYATVYLVSIEEFERQFQDFHNNSDFTIFTTTF